MLEYIQHDSNKYNDNNDNNSNDNNNSNSEKTELLDIIWGVPQQSILGPLRFILYKNDLWFVSKFLKPFIFADDTNLYCSNKEKNPLFLKANLNFGKISEWFRVNKLPLNEEKTRFTLFHWPQDRDLFHRPQDRDNLSLRLPALRINDNKKDDHLQLFYMKFWWMNVLIELIILVL